MLATTLMLSALCTTTAQAERRVALVIGNSAYQHDTRLVNPGNDATDMAKVLRNLGFEVIQGKDLDLNGFDRKLDEFERAARQADVSLFFYSGHGLQADKKNYLVPIDAKLDHKRDLKRKAVELDIVIDGMRSKTNLVFLDACRNNPMKESLARSMGLTKAASSTRGLAAVKVARGIFIAYATQPGNVAFDGSTRNSPFTKAILQYIDEPRLSVDDMLTKVTNSVMADTEDEQIPWKEGSLSEIFYFNPTAPPPPPPPPPRNARAAYEAAKHEDTTAAYEDFINRFPDTEFTEAAQAQIDRLTRGIWKDCSDCPYLVTVEPGTYQMGASPSDGVDGVPFESEIPRHRVTIARRFAAGVYEVTFSQWDTCHDAGGCSHKPSDNRWGRGRKPVIGVSWHDAKQYVGWLSRKTGMKYRLLSESEWEYVARARTMSPFHTGTTISTTQANYDGNPTGEMYRGQTVVVGRLRSPNEFGLHDVHGNVWGVDGGLLARQLYGSATGRPRVGTEWRLSNAGIAWRLVEGWTDARAFRATLWSRCRWSLRQHRIPSRQDVELSLHGQESVPTPERTIPHHLVGMAKFTSRFATICR